MQEFLADVFTIESWRSLWCVMDRYVESHSVLRSATVSLLIGAFCYILLHFFNKKINRYILKNTLSAKRLHQLFDSDSDSFSSDYTNTITSMSAAQRLKLASQIKLDRQDTQEEQKLNENSLKKVQTESSFIGIKYAELREDMQKEPCCSNRVTERELTLSNRLFLYMIFTIGFIGTVNLWRALWMFQAELCYPKSIIKTKMHKLCLEILYMIVSVVILWCLNLTSSLLSRASCKDDYFIAEKNYIVKHNNFKHFFLKKVTFNIIRH
jgi:hypothetical protein